MQKRENSSNLQAKQTSMNKEKWHCTGAEQVHVLKQWELKAVKVS